MPGNSRSRQKRKPKLEPISYEEMLGAAGMSGFVSFLEISPSDVERPATDTRSPSAALISTPTSETDKLNTPISGIPRIGIPLQARNLNIPGGPTTDSSPDPLSHTLTEQSAKFNRGTPRIGRDVIGIPYEGVPYTANNDSAAFGQPGVLPPSTSCTDVLNEARESNKGAHARGVPTTSAPHIGIPQSDLIESQIDHPSSVEFIEFSDPNVYKPPIISDRGVPGIGIPQLQQHRAAPSPLVIYPTLQPPAALPQSDDHPTRQGLETRAGTIQRSIPGSGIPDSSLISAISYANLRIPRTHRVRRAARVQDGHSLGEQALYDALWQAAQPYSADARIIMVGYRRMSELARLTVNNCKANIKALIQKLAVDEAAPFSHSQGTTYVVYNFSAILQRRKSAGLTFYIRSRGVVFVDPETGLPLTSSTHVKSGTPDGGRPRPLRIPESDNKGVPIADRSGTPEAASHKERNTTSQQGPETSSSFPIPEELIQAFHRILPAIDNDAVTTLWNECRARVEDCTVEEIAYFAKSKAMALNNGKIQNPVGFLLAAVPKCFEGQTFEVFRQEQARRRREQQSREEEERRISREFEEQSRWEAEAYRKAEETLTTLPQSEHAALYERVKSELKKNYPHINWPNRQALEDRIRIGMIRELQKRAGV